MSGANDPVKNPAPRLLVLGDMLLDMVVTGDVSAEREAQRRTARSDPRGWVENMGCTGLLQWLSM